MSTFAELQAFIADDIDRTDLNSQIQNAINRAISHYSTEGFYFQETNGTFSLVSGTSVYGTAEGIPSDIREINYLEITTNGFNYEVFKRSLDYILNTDPTNYDGDPTDYAWYQQEIWFSPNPNAVRTITVYYDKEYTDLSADTDENDFTTISIATDLIRARAEWILYKQILHDKDSSADAKELEMDAYQMLMDQTENFQKGVMNRPFQS